MAKIVELIYTVETRGLGKNGDPVRNVEQYWTKDGKLLFEKDPCSKMQKENVEITDKENDERFREICF